MHVINESSSVVLAPTKQCLQSETMQLPSSGGNLIECINSTMDAAVPDAHTDSYALKASNLIRTSYCARANNPFAICNQYQKIFNIPETKQQDSNPGHPLQRGLTRLTFNNALGSAHITYSPRSPIKDPFEDI